MRSIIAGVVGLIGLATAQAGASTDLSSSSSVQTSAALSSGGATSTTSSASVQTSTTSSQSSGGISSSTTSASSIGASTTNKATAVFVALDGSAEFTAVNAAIAAAQNRAIPTVTIQAGQYSESIVIQGTQTVTIVGPTASGFANNQVNIAASAANGVVSFNTQKSAGVVFRNVNITNTISVASVKAPAFLASGSNMLLDTVALVSGGTGVYQAGLGTSLITNSYIEGIVPAVVTIIAEC